MRQAFDLAIDREAIVRTVMRGQARPTGLMIGPGINGWTAEEDRVTRPDLARARALLAEAGYPNGFGVTMDCPNDRYVNDEAICTAVAAMLARIGARVSVNAQTRARWFRRDPGTWLQHVASTCWAGHRRPTTPTTRCST